MPSPSPSGSGVPGRAPTAQLGDRGPAPRLQELGWRHVFHPVGGVGGRELINADQHVLQSYRIGDPLLPADVWAQALEFLFL